MLTWIDAVPIASQVKSFTQVFFGDRKGAWITQQNFAATYVDLLDTNLLKTTCSDHYCSVARPSKTHENWMASLNDSALITSVTMPGTHDSGSLYGGEFAKCQTWKIYDQLRAGIRFLDIRCKNIKDKFHIYHGIVDCHLSFENVLKSCEQFLAENPSEFIVMRVKEEGECRYATRSFDEIYRRYVKENQVIIREATREITVKQARGKIIILKDFSGYGLGHEWEFKGQIIQDNYLPVSLEDKMGSIEKHFYNARPYSDRFNINFLTAVNPDKRAWPRYFANACNAKALVLFRERKKRFAGIVVMDFPGETLIRECIELNN